MSKKTDTTASQQPAIVRYSQSERVGIRSFMFSRHAIGFIMHGRMLIYYGDTAKEISAGNLFYLPSGHHYIDYIPEGKQPFEQIVVYFTPEQLSNCLTLLSINLGLAISDHHACDECSGRTDVIYPAWRAMRSYFATLDRYIKDGIFAPNGKAIEMLKVMELICLIISDPKCCIHGKLLENSDMMRENFEQIVQDNIFTGCSIEELAYKTNRSPTSFKRDFRRQFKESPHKWMMRKRLVHARLLLISTGKSIVEIGNECNFQNTSHFIKLFKKEFGLTPSVYRRQHNTEIQEKETIAAK